MLEDGRSQSLYAETVSPHLVTISPGEFRQMLRVVRALYRLSRLPAFRELVGAVLPAVAQFDPGHDAVMMGYDFHLTATGPRLIEVNTNAGGALLAALAAGSATGMERLRQRFLASFSAEMGAFSRGQKTQPRHVVILDEEPERQFLFREMEIFADWFRQEGIRASIADPTALTATAAGVSLGGVPVDLIYNRHCDFYLELPQLSGVRAAYLAQTVCLTPQPSCYGLLADKRRMILWSEPGRLSALGVAPRDAETLAAAIPVTRLLATLDREELWRQREQWVFKPTTRYGSRGVLLGRKISRIRFDGLAPQETLAQQLVAPSVTAVGPGEAMKTDFRLFVYRNQVLGVAARLYQGQVTNLRTPGGGFAAVRVG